MSVTATQQLARAIDGPPAPGIGGFLTLARALGIDTTNITLVLNGAPSGLTGTLTVEIATLDGSVFVYFPSTMNIAEVPPGTGRYVATVPKPDLGHYLVVWRYGDQATEAIPLFVVDDDRLRTPLRIVTQGQYELKAGDTDPFIFTLTDRYGVGLDLTSADSITARVRMPDGSIETPPVGVLDAVAGLCMIDWVTAGVDITDGVHAVECLIDWADGSLSTVPSAGVYEFPVAAAIAA